MSQSASHRTGPAGLGHTRDAQSIPINTSVPAMALALGAPPPPSFNTGCIKGWVQEEQAYACLERAYGLLCASHGAGTRCNPPAMGIVTQWAIRLQTSDFYGPSPPTPSTQAPHDRPPPPNIRLVDKWKMGKYGTSENVQHGGKHSTPPPACFES